MAQLAIQGHPTRGKEVIKILEMLGGVNKYEISDAKVDLLYAVRSHDKFIIGVYPTKTFIVFTLEEFLKKFPYKVGDRVRIPEYESEVRIISMNWNGYEVQYEVFIDEYEWYSAEELNEYNEPHKEETMEKRTLVQIDLTKESCIANEVELILGDYEFVLKDNKPYFIKKKPKYPETYVECAKLLGCFGAAYIDGYKGELLDKFQELLICRDAYWKIAGEQMGLGKPWEPDWTKDIEKYVIYPYQYLYSIDVENYRNTFLAFPTREMRDAFYENFKDLIEQCKELL